MGTVYVLLDDKKRDGPEFGPKTFYKLDQDLFEKYNNLGFGVYNSVNSFEASAEEMTKLGVKTKRNIPFLKKLNYVFADLDIAKSGDGISIEEKEKRKDILVDALYEKCKPTFVIETANGFQPLWKLKLCDTDEETQRRYVNVINAIIAWSKSFGGMGDKVKDVTRIVRRPGFYHMKEEPFMITVPLQESVEYSLEEIENIFPYIEKNISLKKLFGTHATFLNPQSQAIDNLDFQDLVKRAFGSIGRQAEFDKQGRLILDERLTGTFQGKHGDRAFLASTSHEPFQGNRITAVADILGITNKEARAWIVKEFRLEKIKSIAPAIVESSEHKMSELEEDVEKLMASDMPFTWGVSSLDNSFSPLGRGRYLVLVGETGVGKTAFAFQVAVENAKRNLKVLYLSLEMSNEALVLRYARAKAGITKKQWKEKQYKKSEIKKYVEELPKSLLIKKIKLEDGDVDLEFIKKIILEGKYDMVFIDNFGFIEAEGRDINEKMKTVSKAMVNLKNITNTTIVALHHFRKGGEKSSKIRNLDSILGSGKIGHDVDFAVQVTRDMDLDIDAPPERKAELTVVLMKDRDFGETQFVSVYFQNGQFNSKFSI